MTNVYYLNRDRNFQINSSHGQYSYFDGTEYHDFSSFASMMRAIIKTGG